MKNILVIMLLLVAATTRGQKYERTSIGGSLSVGTLSSGLEVDLQREVLTDENILLTYRASLFRNTLGMNFRMFTGVGYHPMDKLDIILYPVYYNRHIFPIDPEWGSNYDTPSALVFRFSEMLEHKNLHMEIWTTYYHQIQKPPVTVGVKLNYRLFASPEVEHYLSTGERLNRY